MNNSTATATATNNNHYFNVGEMIDIPIIDNYRHSMSVKYDKLDYNLTVLVEVKKTLTRLYMFYFNCFAYPQ